MVAAGKFLLGQGQSAANDFRLGVRFIRFTSATVRGSSSRSARAAVSIAARVIGLSVLFGVVVLLIPNFLDRVDVYKRQEVLSGGTGASVGLRRSSMSNFAAMSDSVSGLLSCLNKATSMIVDDFLEMPYAFAETCVDSCM